MAVVALYGTVDVLAIVAALGTFSVNRPVGLLALFAVLFVSAEHRDRVFSDETGLSGSIAVGICASTYFGAESWILGTFLVCAAGALYLPQLRSGSWTKVIVNAMCFGASGAVATLVVHAIESSDAVPRAVLLPVAGFAAAAAYWVLNSILLALASSSLDGRAFPQVAWELVRSETVMLGFAVGGAMCGVVMAEVSRWAGLAALVALLVALDVFVISVPEGPTTLRHAWRQIVSRVVGATVGGVVGAAITKVVGPAVLGALLGGVVGLLAGLTVLTSFALVRLWLARVRLDRTVFLGYVMAEIVLPTIGVAGGVVGALAGLGAGIATAAGLVVVVSVVAAWRRRAMRDEPEDPELLLAMVTEAMIDGLPHPSHRR